MWCSFAKPLHMGKQQVVVHSARLHTHTAGTLQPYAPSSANQTSHPSSSTCITMRPHSYHSHLSMGLARLSAPISGPAESETLKSSMQQLAHNPSLVSQGETAPTDLIYEEYAKPKKHAYKQHEPSLQCITAVRFPLNIATGYFCTHLSALRTSIFVTPKQRLFRGMYCTQDRSHEAMPIATPYAYKRIQQIGRAHV